MTKLKLSLFFLLATSLVAYSQTRNVSSLGSAITAKEGKAWMLNYEKHYGNEHGIYYGKTILTDLISRPGVEGVYIFRGLDNSGQEVLIFKGSDNNGMIIHNELIIGNGSYQASDELSSAGSFINEEIADTMIEKFKTTYQDRTPIYLYGKRGFETILQQSNTEGIRFINGLDAQGVEHLVFVGANEKGSEQWTNNIWNHGDGIFLLWLILTKK